MVPIKLDKIIAINLKEQKERRKHILKVAKSIHNNYEIIDAVATSNANVIKENPKLLGHGISHCIALRKVEGCTLILEDDAVIDLDLFKDLKVPDNWQIISLCCSIKNKPKHIVENIYKIPKETVVSAAYLVRDNLVASDIVDVWLKNINTPFPYCVFDYSIYDNNLIPNKYCTYPMVAKVLSGNTTVWEGYRNNTLVMEESWEKYK